MWLSFSRKADNIGSEQSFAWVGKSAMKLIAAGALFGSLAAQAALITDVAVTIEGGGTTPGNILTAEQVTALGDLGITASVGDCVTPIGINDGSTALSVGDTLDQSSFPVTSGTVLGYLNGTSDKLAYMWPGTSTETTVFAETAILDFDRTSDS
jgi:hypothetical protein